MPRIAIRALLLFGLMVSTGCVLTFDATHLGVPVTMAGTPQAAPSGTAFHVTRHPVFLLYGIARVGSPDLEDVLSGELGTGAAVQNLRIKVSTSATDLLFTVITLGVIAPRTVTFEGEIVPHQR